MTKKSSPPGSRPVAADGAGQDHFRLSVSRPTITIGLPTGWARAALAGVGAVAIGWFVPVMVAVLAFWGMADSPWLKQDSWQVAVRVGSSFWAVSLGSPAMVGGVKISLLPLLWTGVQALLVQLLLLYVKSYSRASVWAAVPAFAVAALIIQTVTATPVPGSWWRILFGGSLVAAVGAFCAFQRDKPQRWRLTLLRPGIRLGVAWAGAVTIIGAAGFFTSWVLRRQAVSAAAAEVGATGADQVVLVLMQLAYLPVLVGWAYSWMIGVGFRGVGGALVTPTNPPEHPLPLPIWQVVPTQTLPFSVWWVVAVGIAIGVASGWFLRKRPVREAAFYLAVASAVFLAYLAAWMLLSQGSLGEDQLSRLGPPLFLTVGKSALLLVVPAALVALLTHPVTLARAKRVGAEQWSTWTSAGPAPQAAEESEDEDVAD